MGLEVVDDEKAGEEGKSKEDREVDQGRDIKRKILTGNICLSVYVCQKG